MADSKKYNGSTWEHSLRKLTTATEAVENPLYSDGTAITAYTIKGNTIQNGTGTPDSPVMPEGCGDLEATGEHAGQYKIPISSGGVTTNIYLGSTQTVRQIKKVVLTGNENIFVYSGLGYIRLSDGLGVRIAPYSDKLLGIDAAPASMPAFSITQRPSDITPAILAIKADSNFPNVNAFKTWLAENQITVWYVLATPETGIVNEPLMKIGEYADTVSNAASIPTTGGANSITVDTTVQPSEFTATWTGWHDASVKEYEGGVGNNKFDEQYPDISTTTAYRPIYVGDGTFTMSSTVGREGTSAALYFLAGNVSTGAHNSTNSVYDGQNRTQTAVDGYVTVAYRRIETLSPENYDTMLSKGSTALPYEPYEYGWE